MSSSNRCFAILAQYVYCKLKAESVKLSVAMRIVHLFLHQCSLQCVYAEDQIVSDSIVVDMRNVRQRHSNAIASDL